LRKNLKVLGGFTLVKFVLRVMIFIIGVFLGSYYFVGVSFTKAIQLTFIITLLHLLFLFIDSGKKIKITSKSDK
jgi:type IV secretory pathway TrbL component